jgi:hypothetical protein
MSRNLDQKRVGVAVDSKGSLTLNLMTGTTFVEIDLGIPPGVTVDTPWLNRFLHGSFDLPKLDLVEATAAMMGVKREVKNRVVP